MASGFAIPFANDILDNIFNGASHTFPTELWVAAFVDAAVATHLRNDATASWGPMEVSSSGTGYARVPIMGATGIDFALAASGQTNQSGTIAWDPATGAWGTVYAVALMTALTNGNCFAWHELDVPRIIESPDVLSVPANNFVITL